MIFAQVIGYFVTGGGRPMMEAHADKLLYFDMNRVTMFRTRTAAKTSIKRTLKSWPDFVKDFGDLRVARLTPQPHGESYAVEVDYEQELVLRSVK